MINLNQWLRNGWEIKHPNDIQDANHLCMVKQDFSRIIVIWNGEEFLNTESASILERGLHHGNQHFQQEAHKQGR